MNITIQWLHMHAKPELNDYITNKVNGLTHFYDRIEGAQVTFKIEKSNIAIEDKVCEIRLAIPGNDLFVKKHAEAFELASTRAVDALQEQINKAKDKRGNARPE